MEAAPLRPPTPSSRCLLPAGCVPVFPTPTHRPIPRLAAAVALAAAFLLRPHLAFAQDDSRWSDGTWSGDEGFPDDGATRADDLREGDGYDTWDRQQEREREREERERDRERWREGHEHDRGHGHAYGRREREEERDREEGDGEEGDRPVLFDSGPSMADFRESLNPYGQWIETPEYGLVWRPAAADDGFRPYFAGRWAWTQAGWYWVADEPYGWAVYHYGRWAFVGGLGWAWLPGRVWAPAWVAWRWGEGYAGWCPLGPRSYVYEQPSYYVIVPQPQFLAPVPHYAVPIARAARFFPQTHAMPIARPGPGAGPVVHVVAQAVGHSIRPLPIAEAPAPPRTGAVSVSGGVLQAYRPRSQPFVRAPVAGAAAAPARAASSTGAAVTPARAAPSTGAAVTPARPGPRGGGWNAAPAEPARSSPAAPPPHRNEAAPRLAPAPPPRAVSPPGTRARGDVSWRGPGDAHGGPAAVRGPQRWSASAPAREELRPSGLARAAVQPRISSAWVAARAAPPAAAIASRPALARPKSAR